MITIKEALTAVFGTTNNEKIGKVLIANRRPRLTEDQRKKMMAVYKRKTTN